MVDLLLLFPFGYVGFVVVCLHLTYAVCGLNMHHTQATITITINFT